MRLSHRLETVASFVRRGSNIADIGTDHGYIPICLVERGIAASAVAMDVRSGPLMRAAAHIESHGLSDRIDVRLGDGMINLAPGEADTVILAGMGGELIIRILEDGRQVRDSVNHFVLSPQSDLEKVRRYLEGHGFFIEDEEMVLDDNKYYTVMDVTHGHMEYGKAIYYKYGLRLIEKRHPVLKRYLEREQKKLSVIMRQLSEKGSARSKEKARGLLRELSWIEEAQDEMQ